MIMSHLLDIVDHRKFGRFVRRAHFRFQTQTRERRAQVVRDAREHQRAIGFELFEVGHHLVEASVCFGRNAHASLGQRFRRLPRADLAGGEREPRERPVHKTCDERRAK